MPAKKATATVAKVETERNLSTYLDKRATPLQARFPAWLKQEVGYDPNSAKSKDEAFREGVRLATALRMIFQASDFNRQAAEEEREERESAAPVAKKASAVAAGKKTTRAAAPEPAEDPAPPRKAGRPRKSAAPRVSNNNDEVPF